MSSGSSLETSGGAAIAASTEPVADTKSKIDQPPTRFPELWDNPPTKPTEQGLLAPSTFMALPLSAPADSTSAPALQFPGIYSPRQRNSDPKKTVRFGLRALQPNGTVPYYARTYDQADENADMKRLTEENKQLKQALIDQGNAHAADYASLEGAYNDMVNKQLETDGKLNRMTTELESYKQKYDRSCITAAELHARISHLQVDKQQRITELEQEITRLRSMHETKQAVANEINIPLAIDQIEKIGTYRKKFYAHLNDYQSQTKQARDQIHQRMLESIGQMVVSYQEQIQKSEEDEITKIKSQCKKFDQALCVLDEDLKKIILQDN